MAHGTELVTGFDGVQERWKSPQGLCCSTGNKLLLLQSRRSDWTDGQADLWLCCYHMAWTEYDSFEPPRDKTNKVSVRPAKTQISLCIHPVWSESLLCAQWVAKDPSFLQADREDSDQTGRMPRLIWVFAGRTASLLVLSRGSSFYCRSGAYLVLVCRVLHAFL